jgi:hypothetical protein
MYRVAMQHRALALIRPNGSSSSRGLRGRGIFNDNRVRNSRLRNVRMAIKKRKGRKISIRAVWRVEGEKR